MHAVPCLRPSTSEVDLYCRLGQLLYNTQNNVMPSFTGLPVDLAVVYTVGLSMRLPWMGRA